MSFLNSVLSSIGGGTPHIPTPPRPAPAATAPRSTQLPSRNARNAAISVTSNETRPQANSGQKRKAEEEIQRNTSKAPKNDSARPAPPPNRFQSSKPIARPNGTLSNTPTSTAAARTSSATATKTAQPPPAAAASSAAKAPPKKGSYAEILARAQAAQSSSKQVGVIKHKPVEKLTRKERLAQQAEAAAKAKQGASGKARPDAKDRAGKGAAVTSGKGSDSEITKKKQPVDVGYKGTMRPKSEEPVYKGTMNRAREAPAPKANTPRPSSRHATSELAKAGMPLRPPSRYTYATYSDEEESEGSSDMEAAAYELEEEEQLSLRTARREDEEALNEENELKRVKEEKKRRLAQMAAKRR
ncbi:hypothetical protein L228DRAFT_123495 [Xylona heveae TC161]|uniref:SPT2-domain-containing protein n=1 Tax=Xylona heveae (strain CBS 132557 / TC161) TaxID=1328760 RepID=A0A165HN46_XYLHT|nr:hypothetical protein L228DRAFT_123495 [Xylona heveae TC161]KZF23762.1 hypothetical protein L228DRAFT_123495 [Xylona heveae TC161]